MTVIDPNIYRAVAVKHALRIYLRAGIFPNRAWTLRNQLRLAAAFTGKKYPHSKKGAGEAEKDITEYLEKLKETK